MSTLTSSSEEHHPLSALDKSQGDESECEEIESEESEDGYQEDRGVLDKFLKYAMGFGGEKVSLEGLQSRVGIIPADIIGEKVLEYNILHHYVGRSAYCQPEGGRRKEGFPPDDIELEVVQYILELAPHAVDKADDGFFPAHPHGGGAYPLHLACFNGDCPVSIIKLLFEKNPSTVKHSWEKGRGLPLCCYLARACLHSALGHHEEDEWVEESPSSPSGELDYDVVKMLLDAYPEALRGGTALNILCQGYDVSLELVQLLTKYDGTGLNVNGDDKSKYGSPIRSLLCNSLVVPFPTDAFRYLLESNPSSLEMKTQLLDDSEDDDSTHRNIWKHIGSQTPLYTACGNPNMSAETIGLVIESCPTAVKMEYKFNGLLPLHALCKNKKLAEQSSIDILKLLVSAYPKSVKKKVGGESLPMWVIGSERGKLPIHLAEENMSFGFCKALLSERARLSSIPRANILQIACVLRCSLDMIRKIVEDDCKLLMVEDGNGHIALHTAVNQRASLEVARYLVRGIQDLLSEDEQLPSMPGANILQIACFCKCPLEIVKEIVEKDRGLLLVKDGFGRLALHTAAQYESLKVVHYLVDENESALAVPDKMGELPLHRAANYASLEVVQCLVDKNGSALAVPCKMGELPLHLAAKCASLGVVQHLVGRNESTLTVPDRMGELPLHKAAKHASLEVVQYLIGRNESALAVPNEVGELPLHKACARNVKVVEYLMAKNMASVAVRNRQNQLPIHMICDKSGKRKKQLLSIGYTEIIFKLLMAYPEVCDCGDEKVND